MAMLYQLTLRLNPETGTFLQAAELPFQHWRRHQPSEIFRQLMQAA